MKDNLSPYKGRAVITSALVKHNYFINILRITSLFLRGSQALVAARKRFDSIFPENELDFPVHVLVVY